MRTSTISAAAAGRVAVCVSAIPFSSICHIRDSTRIESLAAKSRARSRSVSPNAMLSAVAMGDRLVEQRQRIAHRTFRRARDDSERLRLNLDVFLGRDTGEMRDQHI